jgi:hypothetical protein
MRYTAGARKSERRTLDLEPLEPRLLMDAAPQVPGPTIDLSVIGLGYPSHLALDGQGNVSVGVGNSGNAASGGFDLGVYLSKDATWDAGDVLVATQSFLNVGAGDSQGAVVPIDLSEVGGLSPGTYYLIAYADPANEVLESNENNNARGGPMTVGLGYVGSLTSPDLQVTVSFYDLTSPGDDRPTAESMADFAVKWGRGDSVSSISLLGTHSMDGLGITISGATSVGSIKDGRKGALGNPAFIASDAPVKSIALKSGLDGYDLNGLTLGGLSFAADIDNDGDTVDFTSIYAQGAVGKVSFGGYVFGDVWVDGSLGSFASKTAGLLGDLTVLGDGGTLSLGGDFAGTIDVHGSLKGLQLKGGNYMGDAVVLGDLGKFSVAAGNAGGGNFQAGADITIDGLLKSAKITACETDNGGGSFGIHAASFGNLTIGIWKLSQLDLPFNQDDFWVNQITI